MPFVPKKQVCGSSIHAVKLGTGERACIIGGQNVLPFYTFDGPIDHPPVIGIELSDRCARWNVPGLREFYAGCETMADYAQRAAVIPGAAFLALHFESADPSAENRSVESCVRDAEAVAAVTDLPLVILGCRNIQKDTELFAAVSEALQGRNLLVLSAREENYKQVGAAAALAYGQKIGAETADDINLAKQLNIMLKALPVDPGSIVMNIGTAAVGYGFEYVASTFDRVRLAALQQSDEDLQMPMIAPVSPDTWAVKESQAAGDEEPGWGPLEDRAVDMEISTAAACLAGGADAVILRHPAAVAAIRQFIQELI